MTNVSASSYKKRGNNFAFVSLQYNQCWSSSRTSIMGSLQNLSVNMQISRCFFVNSFCPSIKSRSFVFGDSMESFLDAYFPISNAILFGFCVIISVNILFFLTVFNICVIRASNSFSSSSMDTSYRLSNSFNNCFL